MALPPEILDQLLGGYLDDALSADERVRVEALLESDADVARQLEELRSLRSALKEVSKADAPFKLPAGFTDRVLDAAIAAAASEGLGEDHPLVRLAEEPSTRRTHVSHQAKWRWAGVLVALAASIVLAVVALRPDGGENVPGNQEIAAVDPGVAPKIDETADPAASIERATPAAVGPETAIASDVDPRRPMNVATTDIDGQPDPDRTPGPERVAVVNPPITDTPTPGTGVDPSAMVAAGEPATTISEIIILDLKQTAAGRENDAVKEAMKIAGIGQTSEKKITKEIVQLGVDASEVGKAEDAKILYLQASAKSIDRFILTLVGDQAGIETVRFTLAVDAPTLRIAQAAAPMDATLVRHAGSWELAGEAGMMNVIAKNLQGRVDFLALDAGTARAAAAAAAAGVETKGPDFLSQVLVVVR